MAALVVAAFVFTSQFLMIIVNKFTLKPMQLFCYTLDIIGFILSIEERNSTVVQMIVSICMGYASSPLLMVVELTAGVTTFWVNHRSLVAKSLEGWKSEGWHQKIFKKVVRGGVKKQTR